MAAARRTGVSSWRTIGAAGRRAPATRAHVRERAPLAEGAGPASTGVARRHTGPVSVGQSSSRSSSSSSSRSSSSSTGSCSALTTLPLVRSTSISCSVPPVHDLDAPHLTAVLLLRLDLHDPAALRRGPTRSPRRASRPPRSRSPGWWCHRTMWWAHRSPPGRWGWRGCRSGWRGPSGPWSPRSGWYDRSARRRRQRCRSPLRPPPAPPHPPGCP
uniref:Putative serine repeat antigen n=1 Tax=Micromonospora inyonensis TaxID=47866 RepID=A0A059P1D6_9ACTN|nr:putative serine repeat antigen [Micromonospora inyonensis]